MARIHEPKLQELCDLIAELKSDLNALRTDFLSHHHGSSGYTATTLRMGNVGITPSGGTSTAVVGGVPEKMFQS